VLALVPARGGSKGLPGKNTRDLAGRPLLAHSVECARRVPSVTRVVVSTDDPGIASVARAAGADVPFLRPDALAGDTAPTVPVLVHALEALAADGYHPRAVLLLEPTSPTRDPALVQQGVDLLDASPAADGVVAVSRPVFNPAYVGVTTQSSVPTGGRLHRWAPQTAGVVRRQDAPDFLRINGNFYVFRTGFLQRELSSWLDEGHHLAFEIPERLAFSIDDAFEFEVLAALVAAGIVPLAWR